MGSIIWYGIFIHHTAEEKPSLSETLRARPSRPLLTFIRPTTDGVFSTGLKLSNMRLGGEELTNRPPGCMLAIPNTQVTAMGEASSANST